MRNNRLSDFFNTMGSLLLSLVLALIVWVVATQQQDPLMEFIYDKPIPITRLGPDAGVVPFGGLLERVTIRLRAPQSSVNTLELSNFSAQLDLRGLPPGTHDVPVKVTSSNPRVAILGVEPETVTVVLEPYITREMPVNVTITEQPPFGYFLPEPTVVTPTLVSIGGAEQVVNQVASAETQLSLGNATAPVAARRPVLLFDLQGEEIRTGLTIDPPSVVISATVTQRPGFRALPVLPNRTGTPAEGYRVTSVTVDPPQVVVVGTPTMIDALPGYLQTTPVSIEGATDTIIERVALELPENVSLASGTQSVTVRVDIKPLEDSITISRPPVLLGVGEGLTATSTLTSVEVVVAGPVPQLSVLKPEDIRVILNAVGLEPGVHNIELDVVVPEGLTVESVVPRAIPVEIRVLAAPTPTVTTTVTATPPPRPRTTPPVTPPTGTR